MSLVNRTSMPAAAAARSFARTARKARPVSPEAIRMNAHTTIAATTRTVNENDRRAMSLPSRTPRFTPNSVGFPMGFPDGGVRL